MKQYTVYFWDDSTETVEAYGYTLENNRAVFDLGRNHKLNLLHVRSVELVGQPED